MGTTNLFVELIVIGVGAAVWIALMFLAILGYEWIPMDKILSFPLLIPILSIVYLFGIVTDRIADILFEKFFAHRYQLKIYKKNQSLLFDDRRFVFTFSPEITQHYNYMRSRMRICRGWTINGLLIAFWFAVLTFKLTGNNNLIWRGFVTSAILSLLLSVGSWYAWHSLKKSESLKLREAAEFLRKIEHLKLRKSV